MELKVEIGLTEELATILKQFLATAGMKVNADITAKEVTVETERKPSKKEDDVSKKVEKMPDKSESEVKAPVREAAKSNYTVADVRAAMHEARIRIEGENYKENTTSEKYQKWHKRLTEQFLEYAKKLGSSKPSELEEDERKTFIDACNELKIGEDGELKVEENLPF
jgi:hypothetical protein